MAKPPLFHCSPHMIPIEANMRIILSRRRLHQCRVMVEAGGPPSAIAEFSAHEAEVLSAIAGEHPEIGVKLVRLVAQWVEFHDILRAKMN